MGKNVMPEFRLTYEFLGLHVKGFDTKEAAIEEAKSVAKVGMKPKELLRYNEAKDEYVVIGKFEKA